ncbi:MAG: RidA family protein [Cognatishimia sp.]
MTIKRIGVGPRSSRAVVHNSTAYLCGQVGTRGADIATQTRECLEKIDQLLAEVGSDKSKLLQVEIWLSDMKDFAAMNEVYDAWIDPAAPAARACGEAKLASSELLVEFIVTAAV